MLDTLMARYRDPLLRAAFDLQSRLYNIVEQDFLGHYYGEDKPDTTDYARDNTLYVLAEYLGWIEILRREVRFLDLGDEARTRTMADCLDAVRFTLLTDRTDDVLKVFNGEQRAIGEVMTKADDRPDDDGMARLDVIGFAEFTVRLRAPDFDRWFRRLRSDVDLLAREPGRHVERIVALQNALVDLTSLLDPDHLRLPERDRKRLTRVAASPSPTPAAPGAAT
jgi:hypothetical protein